jgi:hypothetical protein
MHVPTKKWMMDNFLEGNGGLKKRKHVGHKKTKQKAKIEKIDLLLREISKKWFFER